MFRVVSSTETSVGTVVNVSCPAGQKLQTGHTMMKTLCTRSGDWSPQVPDCVGKLNIDVFILVSAQTRNPSRDETENVNFLYDDIVHVLKIQ